MIIKLEFLMVATQKQWWGAKASMLWCAGGCGLRSKSVWGIKPSLHNGLEPAPLTREALVAQNRLIDLLPGRKYFWRGEKNGYVVIKCLTTKPSPAQLQYFPVDSWRSLLFYDDLTVRSPSQIFPSCVLRRSKECKKRFGKFCLKDELNENWCETGTQFSSAKKLLYLWKYETAATITITNLSLKIVQKWEGRGLGWPKRKS
jgi:hypothetical protein